MHSKTKALKQSHWIVVHDTHEPIIDGAQWNRVQALLGKDTRSRVTSLLEHRRLTALDRLPLAELVDQIRLFEDGKIEISYKIAIPEGMLS